MRTPLRIGSCLLAGMVFFSVSAHADWLVTTAGGRVETKGPWQMKGKVIVFTTAAGALSSLRASDVDLQASAQATTAARAVASTPQPAAPLPKAAVMVITDADVGHVTDNPATAAAEGAANSDASGAPAAAAEGTLSVAAWEQVPMDDDGGVEIFGSLRNGSSETVSDISVTVRLFDEGGSEIATAPATVPAAALPPGQSVNFRVAFPGIIGFQTARFTISSRGFVTQPRATPEPASQS